MQALKAKKHVFVEKPLALQLSELKALINIYNNLENLSYLLDLIDVFLH